MRILFICSRKFDYGQDLTFSGLVDLLGPEAVRDYPWNPSYHLPFSQYPKNLGVSQRGSAFKSLRARNINQKNADLIIVGACKPDAFETYLSLIHQIPKNTPIALIDGGDREDIGGDLTRLGRDDLWRKAISKRAFNFIFKREYLKGKSYDKNIHPLPFSINLNALKVKPAQHFDKEFSFWAMESHPIRTRALEILAGQFDCDNNGTKKGQSLKGYAFKGLRYHEELAKTKIVLSLRGGGWDTLRYWEIPALGPLMISTELDILIPMDFEDQKHIVRCKNDLSDLLELGSYYLKNEALRLKIAQAGREHLLKYHTNVARARYMLDIMGHKK